ncbi:Methylcrotonoyl-carboxylase subunit mitochondrial [Micractinium conductrix]|uniref:Methylcrotonoyl-carboxylase subunit mitochondrial n=1 Tax=Micractinium conductrix TaxID=554055 RepID=A0A2P6VKW5_9CHLO|nr:Methylcrotonoyl-carboxylase subunit mitochondrial [Micractinium conductrix]|eukprot:PSC74742.1 Methylcrotonoyl-carboxylase subunit mitochondrial [Micractinium conductrix]
MLPHAARRSSRRLLRLFSSTSSQRPPPALSKVLVANRGEIACRVLATARRLGIPSVAVFSEADRHSKHVALADEAFCIGPPAARESYLRTDRILEVAERTGASAVHPGYGFLSENSGFAAACEQRGIAFVGPPASAIRAMGDKSEAKALMAEAGVPVVPGYHGEEQGEEHMQAEADRIGYPLLVKAVMGGGGKGMKLASAPGQFMDALHSARREAAAAFGDERVLLERFITRPRHIEVQVFADAHGNAVYLFERDCSVQRRHQKVIEEAPAPGISAEFRRSIGESAVAAARAVGYRSAGTVEFIVDVDSGEYFFMEMNTRLQVEHPVSEAITGHDLVEWQLRVAAQEALPLAQEQLSIDGHAFEARIYAENPDNNFLPAGGRVLRWRVPPGAAFFENAPLRVDSGVQQGDLVGVSYDPMIAKLVCHAPDRATALARLHTALAQLQVGGLPTNVEFLKRITQNKEFQQGAVDTSFIAKHEGELLARPPPAAPVLALAAVAWLQLAVGRGGGGGGGAPGPWSLSDSFRVNHSFSCPVAFSHSKSGGEHELTVACQPDGTLLVSGAHDSSSGGGGGGGGGPRPLVVSGVELSGDSVSAEVDGQRLTASWCLHSHGEEEALDLWINGTQHQFRRPVVRRWLRTGAAAQAAGSVVTPMPGRVVKVFVSAGQSVAEGDPLVVVEAMKMEHTVRAPFAGTVAELHSFAGGQVEEGHVLAVVALAGEAQGGEAQAVAAGAA